MEYIKFKDDKGNDLLVRKDTILAVRFDDNFRKFYLVVDNRYNNTYYYLSDNFQKIKNKLGNDVS